MQCMIEKLILFFIQSLYHMPRIPSNSLIVSGSLLSTDGIPKSSDRL